MAKKKAEPKAKEKRTGVTIYLTEAECGAIERLRDGLPRAIVLRRLILRAIERGNLLGA